jgi:hypothetical protein
VARGLTGAAFAATPIALVHRDFTEGRSVMDWMKTKGRCEFCGNLFSKSGIGRHLQSCEKRFERTSRRKPRRLFHIAIEGTYAPMYWMHVEAPDTMHLSDLDTFLREIWLECCGHLSDFTIGGQTYSIYIDDYSFPSLFGPPEIAMYKVRLRDVLKPGMRFTHRYDFGTTTDLKLRVVSERVAPPVSGDIQLLARNEPPVIPCGVCGKPATRICVYCVWRKEGWLCDSCFEDHECDDEMYLPVVNSPRTGMCAYTGPGESVGVF